MEKAIEIKRRAQRCIQNGDLDGALREYEKLVGADESDPYNFVLLADLLYKKGDMPAAAERYLSAVAAYEKASLYKNAIAVCKKMLRLSLSQARVLQHLANLHALDGLTSEAALYYIQYAEQMMRGQAPHEAAVALRKAFDASQENVKVLEQLGDALLIGNEPTQAAETFREAARHWHARGFAADAERCVQRAAKLDPTGTVDLTSALAEPPHVTETPAAHQAPALEHESPQAHEADAAAHASGVEGFETGSRFNAPIDAQKAESGAFERQRAFVSPADAAPASSDVVPVVPSDDADARETTYEISAEEMDLELLEGEPESTPAGVYEIALDDAESEDAPAAPGLHLVPPATSAPVSETDGMALVERLLAQAQEQFRTGDRDQASGSLASAAQAYEAVGRLDSAATIYRSLGRGAQTGVDTMMLWLANCERRQDTTEAAQVACELGDRVLNDGEAAAARQWFERAVALDSANETARRRLQRMNGAAESAPAAPAERAPTDTGGEMGRIEVAVGRGEAVTFDLTGLLAEFQRGVEAQLAGDAQSHYDLGMTYREMGLLEQAVDSFRISQDEPRLAIRSMEMIGRCFADQGRNAEATLEFERALLLPDADEVAASELRYQLGCVLQAEGDFASALANFEFVTQHLPGYQDVDDRVRDLRQGLGKAA